MANRNSSDILLNQLIGESEALLEVKEKIKLAAPTDARVLITGESGTGKTLIARLIHELHPQRRKHNFRRTNMGALVTSMAQSQLYGHAAHAFTGADRKHDGILVEADKGTFFLDEIAATHPEVQIMLLNLLEIPIINPVGGDLKDRKTVDVRFIAAASLSIEELGRLASFRKELFFRITEYVIELKPLRERKADIEPLARHFMNRSNPHIRCVNPADKNGRQPSAYRPLTRIEPEALSLLTEYDWPGNIRELEYVIRAALVASRVDPSAIVLKKDWIPLPPSKNSCSNIRKFRAATSSFEANREEDPIVSSWDIYYRSDSNGGKRVEFSKCVAWFRSEICRQALQENYYNQTKTARMLGIDPGSLAKYIRFDPSDMFNQTCHGENRLCRITFKKYPWF